MTTDCRAALQELHDAVHEQFFGNDTDLPPRLIKATNDAGRLLCAQPEPEGPTRGEAVAVYTEVIAAHDCQTPGEMTEHVARAALAEQPVELPLTELDAFVAYLNSIGFSLKVTNIIPAPEVLPNA